MGVLVRVAKMLGYGQPKPSKDLFNGGVHQEEQRDQKHSQKTHFGRDPFNGGYHKGKPHKPQLDSGSGPHEWTY